MKVFLIAIAAILFSCCSNAQQNKDSSKNYFDECYQKWLSVHDSILSDSLFNSYSDFRKDTDGKLGLRIKYFEAQSIPFEGLSKKRILEFLGKPNSIDSTKNRGDSIQTLLLFYDMGSVEDSVSEEEHKNGVVNRGKRYSLQIRMKNNRASSDLMDVFNAYHTAWFGSNW